MRPTDGRTRSLGLWAAAALSLSFFGCREAAAPAPVLAAPLESPRPAPGRRPVDVTVLYTSDEHGWLLSTTDKGEVRGGAAEILGRWVEREGHCPGEPPPGVAASGPPPPSCADPSTLLLSGGDNWTGPAISSYFRGEPMAAAMRRMGYAASAFGNHELDFGREQFVRNRETAGFPYLAANLRVVDPAIRGLGVSPYVVLARRGVSIGVVGVVTEETLTAAMGSRFVGLAIDEIEPSLESAIPKLWAEGVDAVLLVAHECPDELEPVLARHPEWRLAFAFGGHCHKIEQRAAGGVPVVAAGWKLHRYLRVRLAIDPARAPKERVVAVDPSVVEVTHREGSAAPAPPDPPLAQAAAVWQRKLDAVLGEPIGYTAAGVEHKPTLGAAWIAEAWRQELGVDVAIVNRGGLRQALPKGAITKASVFSIMPFDNRLLVFPMVGRELLRVLRNDEALAAGIRPVVGGGFADDKGTPIRPEASYSVATVDFLFYGGASFTFQDYVKAPKDTGLDWRAPVIDWTRKQATTPDRPLEAVLAAKGRPR